MLVKKNKSKAPKKIDKERRKLERALKTEACLLERLRRLRETRIFRNIVGIKTSEEKPKRIVGKKKTGNNRVAVTIKPVATSKRQRKYSMIYRSLGDVYEKFSCYCCECGQQMKVHAHGVDHPIKEEVISAACWNNSCSKRGTEVKFRGEQLQPQTQPELANEKEKLGVLLRLPAPARASI